MNICKAPETKKEFEKYYQLRWKMLREPWGQALGSEKDALEDQSYHRFIISPDGEILAVGRLHLSDQYHAQIRYIAVADNIQGQGLGRKIIAALEEQAREKGVREIQLNAREGAVDFYKKLNYQEQGFSHQLYGEVNHYSMSKTLTPLPEHQALMADELTTVWHKTIPMSNAMNIEITHYDNQVLLTTCDLDFNKNLHNTMFAGSLYTLATLTGWGWVYLQQQQYKVSGDIVLADAKIRYHHPLKGVAYAKVNIHDTHGDITVVSDGNKAKYDITVTIGCGDKVCATFSGLYVVIPEKAQAKEK